MKRTLYLSLLLFAAVPIPARAWPDPVQTRALTPVAKASTAVPNPAAPPDIESPKATAAPANDPWDLRTTPERQRDPLREFEMEMPADLTVPRDSPLAPVPAPNLPGPFDLNRLIAIALRRNPGLLTARSQVRQLFFALHYAGSIPNSLLTAGSTYGQGIAPLATSYSGLNHDFYLTLTQNFWPLGSFGTGKELALHDFYASRANLRAVEVTLIQNIKDNFYQVLAGQEKVKVDQANLELEERIYFIAQERHRAGAGPRLDLISAQVQLNRAKQSLVLAKGQLKQSQAVLAPYIGLAGHTPIEVAGSLIAPGRKLVYNALLELARGNPNIEAARQSLLKAEYQTRYSRQQSNPTPAFTATYDITSPSYVLGLTLSVPFSWGQIGYDVKQKQELARQQEANLQQTLLNISSGLQSAYANYQAASENAGLYLEQILLPQEEVARITAFGFSKGAISYSNLLLAQQQLIQVRSDYIDTLVSVQTAFDALEASVGTALDVALNRTSTHP
jgi:outer membrane protein TolC